LSYGVFWPDEREAVNRLSALSPAAPPAAAQGDYWPMQKGAKWHYNVTAGAATPFSSTTEVTTVETNDGRTFAILHISYKGAVQHRELYGRIDGRIFLVGRQGAQFTTPIPILNHPPKKDDQLEFETSISDVKMSISLRTDFTKVTVPAGTFEAFVVTRETTDKDGKTVEARWLAPGVGPVKVSTVLPHGGVVEQELEKYEPGG
jgi:hypothetical protein